MDVKDKEEKNDKPHVIITEQPQQNDTRFRYESESKYISFIKGENSTSTITTYPAIRILNYEGEAFVVVSCVTTDKPYKPHPFKLMGPKIRDGLFYGSIKDAKKEVVFSKFGIQYVKRKEMEEALTQREEYQVDPFNTGFKHKYDLDHIDVTSVRLCFQVFIQDGNTGATRTPLKPVVSNPIYDRRAIGSPKICHLSHYSAPVSGGSVMVLLCEKISKDDILVQFLHEESGWEGVAQLTAPFQHKNVALIFKTPKFHKQNVDKPVNIKIQLKRLSDGQVSEPVPFLFTPSNIADYNSMKRKRLACRDSSTSIAMQIQSEIMRLKNMEQKTSDLSERFTSNNNLDSFASKIKKDPFKIPDNINDFTKTAVSKDGFLPYTSVSSVDPEPPNMSLALRKQANYNHQTNSQDINQLIDDVITNINNEEFNNPEFFQNLLDI